MGGGEDRNGSLVLLYDRASTAWHTHTMCQIYHTHRDIRHLLLSRRNERRRNEGMGMIWKGLEPKQGRSGVPTDSSYHGDE